LNYIEPGTYITELFKPQAVVPPGLGFNLVLVGIGDKNKTIVNEAVVRGGIYNETLILVPDPPDYTADLVNDSDEKKENTVFYKDGNPLPLDAFDFVGASTVKLYAAYYSETSVYTIDYVSIETYTDALDNDVISSMDRVGLFKGSSNYKENTDFEIDAGGTPDVLDWDILTKASFTGLNSEPFDLSTVDEVKLSVDGKPALEVAITGAVQTAVTAAEVAAGINTALGASGDYGTDYNSVASDDSGKVKLDAPGLDPYDGYNSVITLFTSVNSALDVIFGLDDAGAPYEYRGVGKRPLAGQTYYATYKTTRDDAEYNAVRQFISDIDYYNDIGLPAGGNDLANAGSLAWSRGVLNLYIVQVKDADDDGIYTNSDFTTAIDALVDERDVTDIVVLRSNATIRAKVKDVVENESAQGKSNFKRYWCGMPRGSILGDVDTIDSAVFVAKREFATTPASVARGRFIVVMPSDIQQTIIEDTVEKILDIDSNYMATILAAETVSFERASDSMFGKSFAGLALETNLSKADMRYAAANGIVPVFQEGGVLKLFDALTTDASGDARYEEPSSSTQKDNLAFKIIIAVDNNLRGIVPDNPAEFVGTVKAVIGGIILGELENGNIGYYLDEEDNVRDIDYTRDIVVFRDAVDPRTYRFRYFFFLRTVAKRFFGEYVVSF
jgi:hypothetical protein